MGTGSEFDKGRVFAKKTIARCLSPFFTVAATEPSEMGPSEKGDRHRRYTPKPLHIGNRDGASPHFRTPVFPV